MSVSRKQTKYGIVYRSTTCKDDWPNMRTMKVCGQQLHMQLPAIRAYRQACVLFAEKSGWTDKRIKHEGGRAILLTGSWRSCRLQAQLYASDSSRFASPNGTLHTQGLAIDVSTALADFGKAHAALEEIGWTRARSDEPWHHSWGFSA